MFSKNDFRNTISLSNNLDRQNVGPDRCPNYLQMSTQGDIQRLTGEMNIFIFSGAFLIPFFIMLILCGVPLLYMEMAVGQFTQQGPIGALAKLCPILKGKHNFLGIKSDKKINSIL